MPFENFFFNFILSSIKNTEWNWSKVLLFKRLYNDDELILNFVFSCKYWVWKTDYAGPDWNNFVKLYDDGLFRIPSLQSDKNTAQWTLIVDYIISHKEWRTCALMQKNEENVFHI